MPFVCLLRDDEWLCVCLAIVVEPSNSNSFVYPSSSSSDESESRTKISVFKREKQDPSKALMAASKKAVDRLNKRAKQMEEEESEPPCTPIPS